MKGHGDEEPGEAGTERPRADIAAHVGSVVPGRRCSRCCRPVGAGRDRRCPVGNGRGCGCARGRCAGRPSSNAFRRVERSRSGCIPPDRRAGWPSDRRGRRPPTRRSTGDGQQRHRESDSQDCVRPISCRRTARASRIRGRPGRRDRWGIEGGVGSLWGTGRRRCRKSTKERWPRSPNRCGPPVDCGATRDERMGMWAAGERRQPSRMRTATAVKGAETDRQFALALALARGSRVHSAWSRCGLPQIRVS